MSERQQVIAIIAGAVICIFGLWFFLLMPLNHRRQQLERDIQGISAQLAQQNYLLGEEVLLKKQTEAESRFASYCDQWTQIVAHLSMSLGGSNLVESDVGHIDFKVRLFEVQARLRDSARDLKIKMPRNLGLDDSVDSNEDARNLMLQLRAVEEIVALSLSLKIEEIQYIEPLPPIAHTLAAGQPAYFEEIPVRLRFFGTTSNLCALFQSVFEEEYPFVFRNLRVEKASPSQPDRLDVTAVMSALIVSPDLSSVAKIETRGPAAVAPMGY